MKMTTKQQGDKMEDKENRRYSSEGRWWLYGSILYLLTGIFSLAYALLAHWSGDFWKCTYLVGGFISFSAFALLPLLLPLCIWVFAHRKVDSSPKFRLSIAMLSAILAFMIHLFLTIDLFLLHFFGYHINGLVVNLLLTPGGFESMGLDWHSLLPGGCMIVLLVALEILLAWWSLTENKAEKASNKLMRYSPLAWIVMATFAICFIVTLGCGGVASFKAYVPVMESMDTYPLFPNIRMRHFLRAIGMKENTNREFALQGDNRNTLLNYPSAPITRKAHGKTNIVWLVAESLRADMLTSEIMPNAWRMASRGWRFPLHFSGGNGTRPGMFSMFYGLYANNWNAFLRSSRSPLVQDWFKEDGAAFLCQTSAKFTYPEFDRTIFSGVKPEDMKEYGKGKAWERDIDNANAAADFIRRQKGESPFFLFCFFECTHAPYSFPENEALRKDYLQSINYALVSPKDAPRLYNRSVNAAHHLDVQLERIFKALEECEALDDTIVILTGDHGEEFYEKGRLGHNSAFTHEQMHVPLVLLAPGLKPNVYEGISHHTDIVPTLAPFLGVENPVDDYSVGGNLLDSGYRRNFFVSCGWDTAAIVTQTRKFVVSLGSRRLISQQTLTTFDDVTVKDEDFIKENIETVTKAQHDMTKFVLKRKK